MSSTLSVAARDDIWITNGCPSWDFRLASSYELWRSLLTTSAVASASCAKDLRELADHCLYFARIYKLVQPGEQPPLALLDASGQIAKRSSTPWLLVHSSWTPPTPPSIDAHPSQADLDTIALNLQQRTKTPPHQAPYPSGRLRRYTADIKAFSVANGRGHDVLRAYLFDTVIYFAVEAGPRLFARLARDSQLDVVAQIRLADIDQFHLAFSGMAGALPLGIELVVRDGAQSARRVTLGFSSPAELVAWESELRALLQARSGHGATASAVPADVVNALAHVADWRGAGGQLGAFVAHATVTIAGDSADPKRAARVGAYLFTRSLVVLYSVRGYLGHRVHLVAHINLAYVQTVSLEFGGLVLLLSTCEPDRDDGSLVRKEYTFDFDDPTQAAEWLHNLKQWTPPCTGELFAPPAPSSSSTSDTDETWCLAGAVFLAPSTSGAENEYDIGVAVIPAFQSSGLATHGVAHALGVAFDTLGAHRVLARVLHDAGAHTAGGVRKFVQLGFSHEGVRRRAAMHPAERCWVDVSELAVLDSDWAVRHSVPKRAPNLWDEMFARHQREREQLLRWEAVGGLRRTKSSETVHAVPRELEDAAPTPSMVGDQVSAADDASVSAPARDDDVKDGASAQQVPPPSHSDAASRWEVMSDVSDVEPLPEKIERWTATTQRAAVDASSETESWDDLGMQTDDEGLESVRKEQGSNA